MKKNIIVSNRLPVQIIKEGKSYKTSPSSGGLATGLKSVHQEGNSIWIGWPGIEEESMNAEAKADINTQLEKLRFEAIHLNHEEIEDFYYGLSNECLWPLFHYFTEFTNFDEKQWESYKAVNQKFADKIIACSDENDTIWIHDYQLLLCPAMVREQRPGVSIGFFLHIPFPSFEIFRIFARREELLKGMLGADLLGFHTYDYQRHFISSVTRLLRLSVNFNEIEYQGRRITVNTFPMGIDYEKFEQVALKHKFHEESEKSELRKQLDLHKKQSTKSSLILSIDRLDYTKGVVNRLEAFELFLETYPEYIGKVRLIMLAVPSRSNVYHYQQLKRETDEVVGRINGKFAQVNWTPIWYFYRSMPFDDLIDLYISSDVAMITPVRDGMNLVAKEYLATRTDDDGVLILSEMAGASKEIHQALLVNPFDSKSMVQSIKKALDMPKEEQEKRNKISRKRIKRYHVEKWAIDFMQQLNESKQLSEQHQTPRLNSKRRKEVTNKFHKAKNSILFFDYDGTLVGFNEDPSKAIATEETISIIEKLSQTDGVKVVIISGRDLEFLSKLFGHLNVTLVAEHGYQIKDGDRLLDKKESGSQKWMEHIYPVLQTFTDRTPGTFIEEKTNSLVWHYRKSDPELSNKRAVELKTLLNSMIPAELKILDGDCVIEVVNSSVNKGTASSYLCSESNYDFILAMGDDVTDENMFVQLPDSATTIKIGKKPTQAKYYIATVEKVHEFIEELSE